MGCLNSISNRSKGKLDEYILCLSPRIKESPKEKFYFLEFLKVTSFNSDSKYRGVAFGISPCLIGCNLLVLVFIMNIKGN